MKICPRCNERGTKNFCSNCGGELEEKHSRGLRERIMESFKKTDKKVISIVLLGETGIGKTTFINAFGNYITYNSYKDVIKSREAVSLVDTKFLYRPKHKEKEVEITIGDPLADRKPFFSDTTVCKSYLFTFIEEEVECQIRLIDTPGLLHVEQYDQTDEKDDEFITMVVDQLSTHVFVDGYLLLLSPNNARYSERLRYCVERMLTELDKKADPNILLGYTKCFSNFETAPDTKGILKEFDFQVDDKKEFFFENTPTRILAVLQNGEVPREKESDLEIQWDETLKQYAKLISTVISLPTHVFEVTIKIVRQKIKETLPYLLECIIAAEFTLNQIEEARKNNKPDFLERKVMYNYLDTRKVVCTNGECSREEVFVKNGYKIFKTKYNEYCCDGCTFRLVLSQHEKNRYFLFLCDSMTFSRIPSLPWIKWFCKECDHPTSEHMQMSYELEYKESKCENLKEKELNLQNVRQNILTSFALIHYFLKANTLLVKENPVIKRIKELIKLENEKKEEPDHERKNILQKIQKGLEMAILSKERADVLTVDEINKQLTDLTTIPEYGIDIQKLLNKIDEHEIKKNEEPPFRVGELPMCSLENGLKELTLKENDEQ